MIDLDAIVARVAEATAERLRPMVDDAVKAAFAAKAEPRTYFAPELAKRFGKTPDAFRMWLRRGGKGLAALAFTVSESHGLDPSGHPVARQRQAWRADDVEAFLSKRGGGK